MVGKLPDGRMEVKLGDRRPVGAGSSVRVHHHRFGVAVWERVVEPGLSLPA